MEFKEPMKKGILLKQEPKGRKMFQTKIKTFKRVFIT